MKFPSLIHVTFNDHHSCYEVHKCGVHDLDEHRQPVAIYQLVSTGEVRIEKRYVEKRPQKRQAGKGSPLGDRTAGRGG